MQNSLENSLQRKLDRRRKLQLERNISVSSGIDFCSNDYLGLAKNTSLIQMIHSKTSSSFIGATGSRLLSGSNRETLELEEFISDFHNSEDCLLIQSGFDANFGLFSCIADPADAIIYDELIHASVHEGIKTSRAAVKQSFKHNDALDLLNRIENFRRKDGGSRNIFVALESIYSMDGDYGKLDEFVKAIKVNQISNVYFIVDEAHATGIAGPLGRGMVSQLGLENEVFARVHTFGKAVGTHGACILGSSLLKQYLLNYCKPVIFSTFLPYHSVISIRCAYDYLIENQKELSRQLTGLITHFRVSVLQFVPKYSLLPSETPIQGLIIPGNKQVINFCKIIQHRGFDVRPIRSPTVPVGKERIRICIHANNTFEQIDSLVKCINVNFARMLTEDSAKL